MLVKRGEANKMYCPFKFSKPVSKESGQINPEWICEGPDCMAWQKIVGSRWVGEHGYCGLAGKPSEMSAQSLGLSITGLSRGGPNLDFIQEKIPIGFGYKVKFCLVNFQ